MTSITLPITKVLEDAMRWGIRPDGSIAVILFSAPDEPQTVPDELLAQAHPDFPDALRAYIKWQAEHTDIDFTSAVDACSTLGLLNGSFVSLQNTDGDSRVYQVIESLTPHALNPPVVYVRGLWCQTDTAVMNGKSVRFTTYRHQSIQTLYRHELDAKFPGWLGRWQIAAELGLRPNECMHYTFGENPGPAALAELPDMDLGAT